MDENVKNNQLDDEQLENVSGGSIGGLGELRDPSDLRDLRRERIVDQVDLEHEMDMEAKGYVRSKCSRCGCPIYVPANASDTIIQPCLAYAHDHLCSACKIQWC